MTADALDAALRGADRRTCSRCGVVCGTGFEDRPELLAHIARRWRVFGNSAETVARLKDPLAFASLCEDCGIPHPETTLYAAGRCRPAGSPSDAAARAEAMSGPRPNASRRRHLLSAARRRARPSRLLFLGRWATRAHSRHQRAMGVARRRVSRFAMAARFDRPRCARIRRRARRSVCSASPPRYRCVGLNSADFLVAEDGFRLLEINPRPSATLDIFEPPGGSLFALHMSACAGALDFGAPSLPGATATAIVYAERDVDHSGSGLAGLDCGSAARRHRDQGRRAVVHGSCFRRDARRRRGSWSTTGLRRFSHGRTQGA